MTQPDESIDPRNNAESRIAEGTASQTGARASSSGAVFSGARAPGSLPGALGDEDGPVDSGTGAGNPISGVEIDPADAEQAVPGDEGPEHPGRR